MMCCFAQRATIFLTAVILFMFYFGDGKYIFVDIIATADQAETYCNKKYGTSLASIHSEIDNDEATRMCNSNCNPTYGWDECLRGCSIGLNEKQKEFKWVWNDGSEFNYNNWDHGLPTNHSEPNNWNECLRGCSIGLNDKQKEF
eukprot:135678_1